MSLPDALAASILSDRQLRPEFEAICDCGGRLAGTPSERRALGLVARLGEAATGQPAMRIPTPYEGWSAQEAALHLLGDEEVELACYPLLRSVPTPPGGIEAEVVPVGRGTEAEFAALAPELAGRIALVRHEYMFAAGHLHRRLKYESAKRAEAVGFLIAGPLPTRAVAGSSGRGHEDGIPALGISPEAASRLARTGTGHARARIRIATEERPETTETILFDVPGGGPEIVVLSAHIDGHDPAESAIDNASGVAAMLAVARALAPHAGQFRRSLRVAIFSAEEWALTGSRIYLDTLPADERSRMALNVNLDSVAGSPNLTALCSGFPQVAELVEAATREAGIPVRTFLPLMANSDHANFAAHGIPALRLVAGFDDPASHCRHVLTAADTRDKVAETELRAAAIAAAAVTWRALTTTDSLR